MWHSLLFFCMILVSFTVVAANFAEAHKVKVESKLWLAAFGAHSVLLLVVGVIDFAHFDPAQESPQVPWQLTAYLDWGWFLLLGLTVVFLPDSPPLRSEYALEHEPLPASVPPSDSSLPRSVVVHAASPGVTGNAASRAPPPRTASPTPAGTTFVGACGRHLVGATLLAFAAWNLSKLPYLWPYDPDHPPRMTDANYDEARCAGDSTNPERPKECLGEETQANLAAWLDGYRAEKLMADPSLFLAPHIAMGVSLQLLGALALYGVAPPVASARVFFPLSIVFALHILPVAHGIPNSLAGGKPVNQTIVALLLVAAAAGHVGLLLRRTRLRLELSAKVIGRAFVAVCLLANLAPFFESLLIVHNALLARYHNGGRWPHPTPTADLPHPDRPSVGSGHDLYARMGCPPLGWLVTGAILFVLPYYIAHIALPRARTVVDRDGDGIPDVLGIVGPKATAPPTRNPRPGAWDADGDGEISWGEVQAKLRHRLMCFAGGRSGGPALWQLLRVRVDTRVEEVRGSGPCVVVIVPERYLEATGECFIIMCLISWALTWWFNP